jgi:DnaK suppressor protein
MISFEERMRAKTESELARVNRWIDALVHEGRSQELASGGDNTPLTEPADAAQAQQQEQARSELLGRLLERAAGLERALRNLAAGTYGLCNLCKRPIHPERLEALPGAAFCLECQTRLEQSVARGAGSREIA